MVVIALQFDKVLSQSLAVAGNITEDLKPASFAGDGFAQQNRQIMVSNQRKRRRSMSAPSRHS
jgi:hypothetical protein